MRILVVNPALPRLDALGACEQDRLSNLDDLARLGHEVKLLTFATARRPPEDSRALFAARGIDAEVVANPNRRIAPQRFTRPAYIDGASWEYGQPEWLKQVQSLLSQWKPDLVWCHTSFVWRPAALARQQHIPTVIRSVNYEPLHLFHERGRSLSNQVRFIGKQLSEREALRAASVLAAITPDEQQIYQRIDPAARVHVLPLRNLPGLLQPRTDTPHAGPLRVFFMGATYNVPHNAAALRFVVDEVVPRVRQAAPGKFAFHILGSKVPTELQRDAPDLHYDGYVPDLNTHLAGMDIALIPSLFGCGMQQKVFEPLCRGFPTLTHRRALAGYAFRDEAQVLLGDDAESYTRQLLRLQDAALRQRLSVGAYTQAASLFNQTQMDAYVQAILANAVGG